MPDGFDSVVMVEVVHEIADDIEIHEPVAPYQHVRPLGEDIVTTELVLPQSHMLRPQDLAACAAAGVSDVAVRSKPKIAVQTSKNLQPGDIIEFNSLMLAGMINEWGGEANRMEPVPDSFNRLKTSILSALEHHDILIINAGSSAGSEDYTARVIENLGKVVTHGVAIKPGHPVVLGVINDKAVIGLPGYPVSASLTCEIFVRSLIESKLGYSLPKRDKIEATVSRKIPSTMGADEYVRVRLGRVGDRLVATSIQRGAGVVMSMVKADGLLLIPRFSEGVETGATVQVDLLRPQEEIDRTTVVIGSHDVTLDLLASELHRSNPLLFLASSNVGSLGGLLAIKRGDAHMAGSHLLDERTGEYNLSFVKKYLEGTDVVLVNLVRRVQGLIVRPGNPKSVATLEDLSRKDVSYVNRQRGSGTRVLLDYLISQKCLQSSEIQGYQREEYTHLGVAAAIAGGRADAGMGVLSAARALNMDFIPLHNEQFDLVVPMEYFDGELVTPVINIIRTSEFRKKVEALGGYDTSGTGEVISVITKSTES
jgi:putative molybdopterin biosynthesis protein